MIRSLFDAHADEIRLRRSMANDNRPGSGKHRTRFDEFYLITVGGVLFFVGFCALMVLIKALG
jgi:hypothetical protein